MNSIHSILRACFVNDHRARAKTEKPAEMSELPPASPLTEAEASQEAASIYLQNTLLIAKPCNGICGKWALKGLAQVLI